MREMQRLREQNEELQKQLQQALSDAAKANQLVSIVTPERLNTISGVISLWTAYQSIRDI